MQIFLLILKVLGILLLSILGILILLISLILFVPVRYQIEGVIEDDFKFRIKGKISWLLSALTIRFSYIESEFLNEIRILGFKYKKKKTQLDEEALEDFKEDEKEALDNNDVAEADKPEVTYSEKTLLKLEEKKEEQKLQEQKSAEKKSLIESVDDENAKSNKSLAEDKRLDTNQNEKKNASWFQKLIHKVKAIFLELKQKVTKFLELLKNGKEKISDIKAVITDETNKRVAALLWKEIKYLLHHFRFRRIDTDLNFGTDDPATTGQILGVLCMFPVLYQYNFHLYPDFESEKLYLTGSFKIAGKVRMIHILATLIRLIKEKEVRAVIKKWIDQN